MLLEATAPALHCELLRTPEALAGFEAEWAQLWQQDARATPFDSPTWLMPWMRHFSSGNLACAIVRGDTAAVGFVPAFLWINPEAQRRHLILLGTGISDYCGGSFHPDHAEAAADSALAALQEEGEWDLLAFEQLPETSPLLRHDGEPQTVCPVLDLPPCHHLSEVIPPTQVQNLRYYRNRAERIGPVEFTAADEHSVEPLLEELFRLNSARWHSLQRHGVLEDSSIQAFHRETAPRLHKAGMLRLYRLTIRGQVAAVLYGFCSHGTMYYYLSGFDAKFGHVSPGTLIIGHAIEQALAEGCRRFDFLRGSERYKYLWGAIDTQTYRLEWKPEGQRKGNMLSRCMVQAS